MADAFPMIAACLIHQVQWSFVELAVLRQADGMIPRAGHGDDTTRFRSTFVEVSQDDQPPRDAYHALGWSEPV